MNKISALLTRLAEKFGSEPEPDPSIYERRPRGEPRYEPRHVDPVLFEEEAPQWPKRPMAMEETPAILRIAGELANKSIQEVEAMMDDFEKAAKAVEDQAAAADMVHQDMMKAAKELAAGIREKGREAAAYVSKQVTETAKMATFFKSLSTNLKQPTNVPPSRPGIVDNSAQVDSLQELAAKLHQPHDYATGTADGLCARCGLDALHPIHKASEES